MSSRARSLFVFLSVVAVAGCGNSSGSDHTDARPASGAGGSGGSAGTGGSDTFDTTMGPLKVTWIQHASVLVEWNNQVIYVDPSEGDFAARPKADLIFITHTHGDHLKPANITTLKKDSTVIIGPASVAPMVTGLVTMANGDTKTMNGADITAVAMYNLTAERLKFHPKGDGNSYLLKMGGKTFFFSGDTECVPEIKALTGVDVAFLCMNLPYTMDVPAAAACAKAFAPKIVYPYHYRNMDGSLSDLNAFQTMVGAASEVRMRKWYP